jgi:hypothetical protein
MVMLDLEVFTKQTVTTTFYKSPQHRCPIPAAKVTIPPFSYLNQLVAAQSLLLVGSFAPEKPLACK